MFQIVTGQDVRDSFNRQHREAQRVEEAEQKRASLKAEIHAERNAFVRGQIEDREKLIERHKGEDRQLNEAAAHRQAFDRAAEVRARSSEARGISREQQHEREQGRGGRSISREDGPL